MEDREIKKALGERNEEKIKIIISQYGPLVNYIVHGYLKDLPQWEEDCSSEVFIDAWRHIDSFHPEMGSFKNWLGAIAKFKSIDYLRKYGRERSDVPEDALPEIGTRDHYPVEAKCLIEALPEPYREVFTRRYFKDQEPAEIADSMNFSRKKVYNLLSHGKRRLRNYLEGENR